MVTADIPCVTKEEKLAITQSKLQAARSHELLQEEQEKQVAERNAQSWNPAVETLEEDSTAPSLTEGDDLSTSGSIEEIQGATEKFAQLLLEDESLRPLYPKALDLVKVQVFEKSFTKLLKACATDLQAEATSRLQQNASNFLRARARLIVNHMGNHLDPSKLATARRMFEFTLQEPKKRALIDSYLASLQPGASETIVTDIPKPDIDSESGGSEQEAPENLFHLEEVKIFILGSTALINLREKFRHLVLVRHFETKSPEEPITNTFPIPSALSLLSGKFPTHAELDTSYVHDNVARAQDPADNSHQPIFVYLNRFFRMTVRVARYIRLWEKPLKPGLKRVRWTCVSKFSISVPTKKILWLLHTSSECVTKPLISLGHLLQVLIDLWFAFTTKERCH
ncbi:MAG: hypothetical protein Q9213_005554 [Squamulea squamosa]